jgi:hypothetical protein
MVLDLSDQKVIDYLVKEGEVSSEEKRSRAYGDVWVSLLGGTGSLKMGLRFDEDNFDETFATLHRASTSTPYDFEHRKGNLHEARFVQDILARAIAEKHGVEFHSERDAISFRSGIASAKQDCIAGVLAAIREFDAVYHSPEYVGAVTRVKDILPSEIKQLLS